jgi:hypothetical protein
MKTIINSGTVYYYHSVQNHSLSSRVVYKNVETELDKPVVYFLFNTGEVFSHADHSRRAV